MKLSEYCAQPGMTKTRMALKVGVTQSMIGQWIHGRRPVSTECAVTIERVTDGQVTRQELRPDDFWKHWPDLAHLKPRDAA